MILFYAADGISHDFVHRLYHAVRRQTAVLDAQIHAAPAEVHADTQFLRRRQLRTQQVTGAGREYVMKVKAGGAAVLHQFPHTGKAGQADHILVQIFPNLVQRFQPVEQLHILHLRQIAGEHLIEMMVCVDQAWIAQHMAGVEGFIGSYIQRRTDGLDEAVLTV